MRFHCICIIYRVVYLWTIFQCASSFKSFKRSRIFPFKTLIFCVCVFTITDGDVTSLFPADNVKFLYTQYTKGKTEDFGKIDVRFGAAWVKIMPAAAFHNSCKYLSVKQYKIFNSLLFIGFHISTFNINALLYSFPVQTWNKESVICVD